MGSGSNRDSTYLIKNPTSDRIEAPSPSERPVSEAPDGRWRTSAPPPGESIESKWWPDRELGKAFRRWTSIPPARGDAGRSVAIKFLVEHLDVGDLSAVGSAPRTPTPVIEHNGRRERGSAGGGGRTDYRFFETEDRAMGYAREAVRQATVNLEAVAARLLLPPGQGDGPALIQAQRWALETEYQALSTEIKLLDQELLTRAASLIDATSQGRISAIRRTRAEPSVRSP